MSDSDTGPPDDADDGADDTLWDRFFNWTQQSDIRLIAVTLASMYLLFAVLVVLEQGPYLNSVNAIVGQWRTLTFLFAAYGILVLALNLHWGYTGMFNIGVAGFMAVGVYTMVLLSGQAEPLSPGQGYGLGLPLPIGVIGGVVAAALVGLLAALPALRLRADYLAIVTLGLSEIIRRLAQSRVLSNWTDRNFGFATGGGRGIILPDEPTNAIWDTDAGQSFIDLFEITAGGQTITLVSESIVKDFTWSLVIAGFLVGIYWMVRRIGYSPFGRVLKAIREDELVAQSLGKDTRWFKIKVFMLGCGLMGLGGILWQGSQGSVTPDSFRPIITFYVFIAVIIGGAGSNTGSIVGAILFVGLLFEAPRQVGSVIETRLALGSAPGTFHGALGALASLDVGAFLAYAIENIGPLQFVLLGVVLVLIIQRRPDGMLGHRTEVASPISLERGGADE